MAARLKGRPLVAGNASGPLLVADEALSFWGGYDQHTGEIIDRRHPLSGQRAAGSILALPGSRGSSTTTAVLLESILAGAAPAGIVVTGVDTFFALASIVADEIFDRSIPVIQIDSDAWRQLSQGALATIEQDGTLSLESDPS